VVEFKDAVAITELLTLAGVDRVSQEGNLFRVFSKPGADIRQALFHFASLKNNSLLSLKSEENSMEDIFRSLTTTSPTA
jgi:ABC-2 type transport system ATP-binding protein